MPTITLLAFTDLHNNPTKIRELKEKAKKADLVICAGDISNFSLDLKKAFKAVSNAIGNKTMLFIPGNHEDSATVDPMIKGMKRIVNIHGKAAAIQGLTFFGFGGGGFSMREPGLERAWKKFKKMKAEHVVFVTHAPVYKTRVDYLPGIGHRGCITSRELILDLQPLVTICGHFHETSGKHDTLGKTLIVNPGPGGKLIRLSY